MSGKEAIPVYTRRTIRTLQRLADQADARPKHDGTIPLPAEFTRVLVVFLETAVPAAAGGTPGRQSLPIYRFTVDDELEPLLDDQGAAVTDEVFHVGGDDSPTGIYALAVQESPTGRLILIVPGGSGDGLPPGTGGCDCGRCLQGMPIPGATQCCDSFLTWTLKNPWLTCATTDLGVSYLPNDQLISEEFTGGDGNPNTFRYLITIDKTGRSYVELRLETDNGGDDVCLRYGREGFRCQCDNEFTREEPYGTIGGISTDDVSCLLCLKPTTAFAEACGIEVPTVLKISIADAGTNDHLTGWFPDSGEVYVTFRESLGCLASCLSLSSSGWRGDYEIDAIPGTTLSIIAMCGDHVSGPDGPGFDVWLIKCGVGGDNNTSFNLFNFNSRADGFDIRIGGNLTEDGYCISAAHTVYDGVITVDPLMGVNAATSTGACGDDCTSPVAPANPTGFCCFDGNCLDYVDEAFCNDLGGSWSADGDCDDSNCNPVGKCCLADGSCLDGIDAFTCVDLLGGEASTGDCSTGCNGACCRATGTCEVVASPTDCSDPHETFYPNVNCSGITCLGSCCCYVGGLPNCCLEANVTENWCAGLSIADCDAGAGTATWIAGDTTCATCSGSC